MTDKIPTNMFQRAILLLALSWLSMGSVAVACSLTDVQSSGQASYRIYANRIDKLVQSDESYIGIIKTETLREYEDTFVNIHDENEIRNFLELEITTIETLLGASHDFDNSKLTIAPKFSNSEHLAEVHYASTPRPFGFWDQLSLSSPKIPWFAARSCSPHEHDTLDTETYYLAIKELYRPMAFEPLTGLQDPLISDFKALIAGRTSSKGRMTAPEFFSHIDGYNDIEIAACPPGTYDIKGDLHSHTSVFGDEDYTGEKAFKSLSYYNSDLSHIRLLDLLGYEDWTGYFPEDACVVGSRYLVLETTYVNPRVPKDWFWGETPIKHRFLKVDNGVVALDNVQSNIKISGEPLISVEKVKAWITKY